MATGAQTWSTTASGNSASDAAVNWAEGMAPSAVNNSARAEMTSVAMWLGDNSGVLVTTGSSSAFTVESKQGSTAVTDGYTVAVRFHAANAASATLNVDGTGAKALHSAAGTAFFGGEFSAGSIARFTYVASSTSWVLNNPVIPSVLHLTGTLTVDGAATLSSSAAVAKAALFSSGITVTNATSFSSNVTVGGHATISSSLEATKASHFSSSVAIDGTLTQSAGSQPKFAVYLSSQIAFNPNVRTKVTLDTEQFDTGSYFDSTTNYRFTPLVAGKYFLTARSELTFISSSAIGYISIGKNATDFYDLLFSGPTPGITGGSVILDMNGTTDFVELYTSSIATSTFFLNGNSSNPARTYFHGAFLGN